MTVPPDPVVTWCGFSLDASCTISTEGTGPDGVLSVIEPIRPDRIGHGIEMRRAEGYQKAKLIALLRRNDICLECFPAVNLAMEYTRGHRFPSE